MRWLIPLLPLGAVVSLAGDDGWADRVRRTQAEQPHWVTPLVTVTPRLEQEFRYDLSWQQQAAGETTVFGGGKGLELIPSERIEIIVSVPPYVSRGGSGPSGWGDAPLLLKYRLASANEESGNYIATAFMGVSLPTGNDAIGSRATILTPTFAAGKGWGALSVQSTASVALPTSERDRLGNPLAFNTALQYRILNRVWPELEINGTYWPNGRRADNTQVFLTPGIVARFRLNEHLSLAVGAGVQTALTTYHTYNHNWILSVRLPFR